MSNSDDTVDRAVKAALAAQKAMPRSAAFRRMAIELAKVAELTLERANLMQAEAGHPQRFTVAVIDAGESRPQLSVVPKDGG